MEHFVDLEKIGILLPYSDFLKLMDVVSKVDNIQLQLDRQSVQLDALRAQYTEALDKIAEINRYL